MNCTHLWGWALQRRVSVVKATASQKEFIVAPSMCSWNWLQAILCSAKERRTHAYYYQQSRLWGVQGLCCSDLDFGGHGTVTYRHASPCSRAAKRVSSVRRPCTATFRELVAIAHVARSIPVAPSSGAYWAVLTLAKGVIATLYPGCRIGQYSRPCTIAVAHAWCGESNHMPQRFHFLQVQYNRYDVYVTLHRGPARHAGNLCYCSDGESVVPNTSNHTLHQSGG